MLALRSTVEGLEAHVAALEGELEGWGDMLPFLELAREARREILDDIDDMTTGEITASEVGNLAFLRVIERETANATAEIAAHYEQAHRHSLYGMVLEKIETEEGESISTQVWEQISTDPELYEEISSSARREAWQKAEAQTNEAISREQTAIVEAEAQRSLDLDRFDTEFAVNHEFTITADVTSTLEIGDRLNIFLDGPEDDGLIGITLTWTKDLEGHFGWKIQDPKLAEAFGIPTQSFAQFGATGEGGYSGRYHYSPYHLAKGHNLYLSSARSEENQHNRVRFKDGGEARVKMIDFETRTVDFNNSVS